MTKVLPKRHLVKSITWRIIATLTTISLAWIITGNTEIAIKVGAVDMIVKFVMYYLHERVWYKYSRFGVRENKK